MTNTEEFPLDLRLAAIITLLSSSSLKGITAGKSAALRQHLDAAILDAETRGCHEHLTNALQDVSQSWQELCQISMLREPYPWPPHSSLLH
ncbi:MAG: hypothetical protein LBB76_02850 [Azoarcus sp.]|jgi:hypothetical protein|nr:hypothetical protein [Azoarcus sp.]